jgi:hypothetical protein
MMSKEVNNARGGSGEEGGDLWMGDEELVEEVGGVG